MSDEDIRWHLAEAREKMRMALRRENPARVLEGLLPAVLNMLVVLEERFDVDQKDL